MHTLRSMSELVMETIQHSAIYDQYLQPEENSYMQPCMRLGC
jgi:hypothetical protein